MQDYMINIVTVTFKVPSAPLMIHETRNFHFDSLREASKFEDLMRKRGFSVKRQMDWVASADAAVDMAMAHLAEIEKAAA